jgi:hypothetical protein
MYVDTIREIVAGHMTPEAPLAKALTATADALDAQIRGLEAVVERVENLEAHNTTAIEPDVA